jgi:peroxiredoxin
MNLPVMRPMKSGLALSLIGVGLLFIGPPAAAIDVGEVAPDFEISTQNGSAFTLSDFRGEKPVYIVFWNTWCSYCIKKISRYNRLQEQIGDKLEIIAINTTWSDSPDEMRTFEEHHHVNYSTAFDTGEPITDRYQVSNVPTEFIVDIDGVIRYRDGVPDYLAAHLPDFLLPYIPSKNTPLMVCKK